jgi:hypothetical protein
MTQTEKYALVMFRDYTLLEIKTFKKHLEKAKATTEVADTAIELHRIYREVKNNQR